MLNVRLLGPAPFNVLSDNLSELFVDRFGFVFGNDRVRKTNYKEVFDDNSEEKAILIEGAFTLILGSEREELQ